MCRARDQKDAEFLVFDNDLLTAEHEGFSHDLPKDVYFCGKKVNLRGCGFSTYGVSLLRRRRCFLRSSKRVY